MNIDPFFVHALQQSSEVQRLTDGRIYVTERNQAQIEKDAMPYCIILFQGASASADDKDLGFVRPDNATVDVLCVAPDRKGVVTLVEAVVDAVEEGFDNQDPDLHIDSIRATYNQAEADIDRPCQFQWVSFACDL